VSIERHARLAELAAARLAELGYSNTEVVVGDGTMGYAPRSPYNVILVSAAAPAIPRALTDQLAIGGRMVVPVGTRDIQDLVLVQKNEDGIHRVRLDGCAFVPLIGEEGFRE
jgi:protein-L-isoaspartate(D-aspartate) O-methyltransferase